MISALYGSSLETGERAVQLAKRAVKGAGNICKTSANKKTIVYNPEKNPMAPMYRPGYETLFKVDAYHFEPPVYYGKEIPKVKEFKIAAGAGGSDPDPSDIKNVLKDVPPDIKLNNMLWQKYSGIKNNRCFKS